MFLPLGDEPNPRGVPVVTYGLMAVNVLVYLFVSLPLSSMQPDVSDPALSQYIAVFAERYEGLLSLDQLVGSVSVYDLVVFHYGFRPAAPTALALFTSMFLHAGFMHLAGNMLFLWIYGDNVEHRLGRGRFLLAYLVTGLAATLFHTVFALESPIPLVGASGAISGVLGFYFLWFPRNRIRLLIAFFPFFMRVVRCPARFVLGVYLVFDNIMPLVIGQVAGAGGVAYGAHIGGFVGGLCWAWWADRREFARGSSTYPHVDQTTRKTVVVPGQKISDLIYRNLFDQAAGEYFRLTGEQSRQVLTPTHSIALGDWLSSHRYAEAALIVYQRHLRDYPIGLWAAEAHLGAGLIQLNVLKQPTAAYQHLIEVFDLNPEAATATAARKALAEISSAQKFEVRDSWR